MESMSARALIAVSAGRSTRVLTMMLLATLVGAFLVLGAQPAAAHETREVGPYLFTVGWISEPAFGGLPNAVSLRIRDAETEEGIEDVDTLEVDITYGDETLTAALRPVFNDPGHYKYDMVPTRPGTWEFRFYGTVGDLEVDETFTSGPETFNDLQDLASVSFPQADPSTAELAERLEREVARMDESAAHEDEPEAAASDDEAAGGDSSDGVARTTGIVALVLGAAGLLLGLRRRPS